MILQRQASNMDHVVSPPTSELWFFSLHVKHYQVFLRQKLNIISLLRLFLVAIRMRSDKQSSGCQRKGDLHITVPRTKAALQTNGRALPAPQTSLETEGPLFFFFCIQEVLIKVHWQTRWSSRHRTSFCIVLMLLYGLCNGSYLLIKLPKYFLTPWSLFLGRGDTAQICLLQVDMR